MNSIKNLIVTVTLLAVSYGAYVVLSNPQADTEISQLQDWQDQEMPGDTAPTVMIPDSAEPEMGFPAPAGQDTVVDQNVNTTAAQSPDWDPSLPEAAPSNIPPMEGPEGEGAQPSHYVSTGAPEYPPNDSPALSQPQDIAPRETANAFEEAWKSIQSNVSTGRLDDALFALSVWYGEPSLTPDQDERCVRLLDELAGTVIYSQKNFIEPAYVVPEGVTLPQIAQQYQVPIEFLARINGIEAPYDLVPGETLKVLRGPFCAELDYQRSEITLFLGRHYAGRFKARIGGEMPDNIAAFEVVVKEPGREYFDRRSGYRVSRDDPNNPYGDRWIGLRGDQITAAHNVGIHVDTGTGNGCIAVNKIDADDLTAILSIGSPLTIKR